MAIFRISFFELNDSGGGEVCGLSPLPLSFTDVGFTVKIADLQFFTKVEGVTPILPVINTPIPPYNNVYTVSNLASSSSYFEFRINNFPTWKTLPLQITVTKAGYITYNRIINVYGFDLKDNTFVNQFNNGITIDIVLSKNTNIYPSYNILNVIKPFTNLNRTYYNLSTAPFTKIISNDVEISLPVDSNSISNSNINGYINFINGDYSCERSGTTYVPYSTPKPYITVQTQSCDDSCTNELIQNTASLTLDFEKVLTVFINGVEKYLFNQFDIEWRLIDYNGNILATQTNSIIINSVPFIFNSSSYTFTFVVPDHGDYIVKACIKIEEELYELDNVTLYDTFVYECCVFEKLKSCNWWKATKTECNTVELKNNSFTPIDIVYSSLNENNEFEVIDTITLQPCTSLNMYITDVNIYKFTSSTTNQLGQSLENSFIIFNDCKIKECLFDYIKKIACGGAKDCKNCNSCNDADYYNFTALQALLHTYMGITNNVFNFNYVFELIPNDVMNDLFVAKDLLNKALEYCEDCKTPCQECE
jgi:hypothetical protein